tara:strand:+ start:1295 stop:2854 length:1560 start_codon:yes stop_codon:yes gene_type:complete
MGFLSKIFKPVSKVLDKIVPNEVKPFLPYAAAFAPMLAPGIMGAFGNSMLSRGLMSGGLNIGSQLAQEGNEGDINELSALLAGGIGALSAPQSKTNSFFENTVRPDNARFDNYGAVGSELAPSTILDKGRNIVADAGIKSSDFLSKALSDKFSKEGLYTMAGMGGQGLMDNAYADAQRALRDYENSEGGGSGYAEGDDTNRGLAVRRAMERGGHEEQTIRDMLQSLQYPDPDPQPLAYGGRVNAMSGGIMSNQRGLINQPGGYAGKLTREDVSKAYKDSEEAENLLSKMIKNGKIDTEDYKIVKKNIQFIENISNKNFDDYENKEELKQAQGDLSRWTKRINQLDERFKQDFNMRANGGRINFRGGGMDASSPDFGGIKEAIKNVDMKEKEDMMSEEEYITISGENGPIRIKKSDYETMPGMFMNTTTSEYGDAGRGRPVPKFAGGGVASVLPQGMEMDYRGGGFIPMGSKERADDVPARVSKNEFVMTADAVKAAGGGSVNQGAKRMYNLMNNLEARV